MDDSNISFLCKRKDQMSADRGVWESHWQDLANHVHMNQADFNVKRTDGDKRTNLLFDPTGVHSNELLAAGIHGMLTNPASEWFGMRMRDRQTSIAEDPDVKRWLEAATQRMLNELNAPAVAFASHLHEFYLQLCAFGTAVMFIGETLERDRIQFKVIPLSQIYIAENTDGIVDTVFREFEMTLRQCRDLFGEDMLSPKMKARLEKGKLDYKEKILHCVYPREDAKKESDLPTEMPFASVYMIPKEKHVLKEGGFTSQPYMVARWTKAAGEVYGRSPAMTALPFLKLLQQMVKTVLRAGQKIVDPPLLVPDDGVLGPVRTVPGGLNYYRASSGNRIEPLLTGANIPIGHDMIVDIREQVRMMFFLDQLQFSGGPQMTATEVIERTERTMRLLGPILGRLQSEFLGPMIDRIFAVMGEQRRLPQAPEILEGEPLLVDYVSPLARAQRQLDIQGILQTLEVISPLAGIDPRVTKVLKAVAAARHVAEINGVPPDLINTDKEIQAEVKVEQEAAARQQMSAMLNQDADTAQKLTGAVAQLGVAG